MSEAAAVMALGARSHLRRAARSLLELIDQMPEHEIAAAGYNREEIATLERIAAWRIDGVAFGDWPSFGKGII
jgi:hypothetical protein